MATIEERIGALEEQISQLVKINYALVKAQGKGHGDDDRYMEPQSFLTQFLAKWSARVDERTRIPSYEELDWMDSNMLLAQVLGVPVYGVEATTHMRMLISKDGEARAEAVQGMQALNIVPKGHYSGLELVSESIDAQRPK